MKIDKDLDIRFMTESLLLAKKAADEGEVPVGAVIVKDGKIISRGKNQRENCKRATSHAEIEAIEEACKKLGDWRLCGCTIYVTLEPCPMCAGAIINSRIERVVYGAKDEKAGSVGSLINLFAVGYNHTPIVTVGVMEKECGDILSNFFKNKRKTD